MTSLEGGMRLAVQTKTMKRRGGHRGALAGERYSAGLTTAPI
jgi:hypothetical protein